MACHVDVEPNKTSPKGENHEQVVDDPVSLSRLWCCEQMIREVESLMNDQHHNKWTQEEKRLHVNQSSRVHDASHLHSLQRTNEDAYPTLPSICNSISLFISTAYSIGSSFTSGSMKPVTIIDEASASVMPRLIR